jgi:hypothetical protein
MGNVIAPVCVILSATGLALTVTDQAGITVDTPHADITKQSVTAHPQRWSAYPAGDDLMFITNWPGNAGRVLAMRPDGSLATDHLDIFAHESSNVLHRWNIATLRPKNPFPDWVAPAAQIVDFVNKEGNARTGFVAVRPASDYDRNLNILGDGPYQPGSAIAAWDGWSGGDPNESWALLKLWTQQFPDNW